MVYIPHSSDKTASLPSGRLSSTMVYIPHSSDKTHTENDGFVRYIWFTSLIVQIKPRGLVILKFPSQVYIPHSSDKTRIQIRV